MYGVALRITPEQLQRRRRAAVRRTAARRLHAGVRVPLPAARPSTARRYADPLDDGVGAGRRGAAMPASASRCCRCSTSAPASTQPALRDDQRRFATTCRRRCSRCATACVAERAPRVSAGVAIHSLRAASAASIAAAGRAAAAATPRRSTSTSPSRRREVDDCVAATGARPIEWLARHAALDARWQLVHATHATPAEIDAVAASGAGVVLCPSTEANLGDGLPDLPRWLAAGAPLSIGSDSHVAATGARSCAARVRPAPARRAAQRRRRAGARRAVDRRAPVRARRSTAAPRRPAHARWGLDAGARADLLVVDCATTPRCSACRRERAARRAGLLQPARPWRDVMVAGRWVDPRRRPSAGGSDRRAFRSGDACARLSVMADTRDATARHGDIRDAVRALCAEFPDEYFRKVDDAARLSRGLRRRADQGRLAGGADPAGVRRLRASA